MEVLSQMFKTTVRSGWIKGFKMEGHSGNNIEISHSLYADDTLLMCEADRNQVLHLRVVLLAFEVVTGLKINLAKSSMFSLNADSDINMLADIMGCKVEKFPTTYLGLPLGAKFKDKSVWNGVIDKCEKILAPWKQQYLSLGGRLTLVNSVLDGIPTYLMSLIPIPASVEKKIDKT